MTFINRIVSAAPLPDKFKSAGFLRSSASVTEQILLSASNFVTALVVVALSGMEALGVYSVILVLANYAKSLFATLFNRQMVLAISAKPVGTQKAVLMATTSVVLLFAGLLILLCLLIGLQLDHHTQINNAKWLMAGVAAYIVTNSVFDLLRQYLYAIDKQVFSLECTVTATALQIIGLAALIIFSDGSLAVYWYFVVIAAGFAGGVAVNYICIDTLRQARWRGWRFSFNKLGSYWRHARFSLVGMSITWLQNQSVTPLLLLLTNPLIVGYFSFARLMVMPLSVINQGLVNNSTPQLRRLAEKQTPTSVSNRLSELSTINLKISGLYIVLLVVAHLTGLFDKLIPDYNSIFWFLGFWIVSIIVTIQRFWKSQFFVVHMNFKFLLHTSAIVALFTLVGMITTGLLTDSVIIPLLFFVGGELLFIVMLWQARRNYKPRLGKQA